MFQEWVVQIGEGSMIRVYRICSKICRISRMFDFFGGDIGCWAEYVSCSWHHHIMLVVYDQSCHSLMFYLVVRFFLQVFSTLDSLVRVLKSIGFSPFQIANVEDLYNKIIFQIFNYIFNLLNLVYKSNEKLKLCEIN